MFSAAVFMRDASGIRQAWWGPSSWDTQRPRLTAGRAQGRGHTHTGRVQGPWARSHGAGGAVGMLTQGVFRGRGHTPTGGFRGCRRTLARAGDMVTCKPGRDGLPEWGPSDGLPGRPRFLDEKPRPGRGAACSGRRDARWPRRLSRLCPRPCPRRTGASRAWWWTSSASRSGTPVCPSRGSGTTSPQVSSSLSWPRRPRLPPVLAVCPGWPCPRARRVPGLLGGPGGDRLGTGLWSPRLRLCGVGPGAQCAQVLAVMVVDVSTVVRKSPCWEEPLLKDDRHRPQS